MKIADRDKLENTVWAVAIGAALAYWAYGTVAHTFLFAYVVFAIMGEGNRVTGDLRRYRVHDEGRNDIGRDRHHGSPKLSSAHGLSRAAGSRWDM